MYESNVRFAGARVGHRNIGHALARIVSFDMISERCPVISEAIMTA